MESKDIVVGGIYEILPESGITHEYQTVKVVTGPDRNDQEEVYYRVFSNSGWSKGYDLDKKHFGKQIGYDATYSDEYKALSQKIDTLERDYEHLERVRAMMRELNQSTDCLIDLGVHIATEQAYTLEDMRILEEKSWMTRDKIE